MPVLEWVEWHPDPTRYYYVVCLCGRMTDDFGTAKKAVAAWDAEREADSE
jgi:hypothetical protein